MKFLLSLFDPKFVSHLVYMLQQDDYEPLKAAGWLKRLAKNNQPLRSVRLRKQLDMTARAKILVLFGYAITIITVSAAAWGAANTKIVLAVATLTALPILTIASVLGLTWLGWVFKVRPERKRQKSTTKQILSKHKAKKIAVMGSFGKTTVKEILGQFLSTIDGVAITPGNLNTSMAHYKFAKQLSGDEKILVFELGEDEPGDIASFLDTIKFDYAIITGIAPNHLDNFSGIEQLEAEFKLVEKQLPKDKILVNNQDTLQDVGVEYGQSGIRNWKVRSVNSSIHGLSFKINTPQRTIDIKTQLLGRHLIGPICACAHLASELGVSTSTIEKAALDLLPHEHRLQPRPMNGGWIIDDSYNGNIEGLTAGLDLLQELDFKRKIYVTPGLAEQGNQKVQVHEQLANKINSVRPSLTVLMNNSSTKIVKNTLKKLGYTGKIQLVDDPLEYYESLPHLLAANTVIMLQNDWTDNYD